MMTLSGLAKLANVSVSTASKAFAGSAEVNKETREMIFALAKAHGCFKKFYNVKYPRMVIALLAPEFHSGLYVRILELLQQELEENGCEICVSTTEFSVQREKELIEYYCNHADVDGIVAIDLQSGSLESYEIPVINMLTENEQVPGVYVDMLPSIMESLAYLKEKNVSSVGFIGEPLCAKMNCQFRDSMKEVGLPFSEDLISVVECRHEQGGYEAMEQLFVRGKLPRALICAYDKMALGAIRCIFDHGLSVPEDIAVLGTDDTKSNPWLNPPLASISCSVEELCQLAVQSIQQQISGKEIPKQQIIPSKFCLRRSFEID